MSFTKKKVHINDFLEGLLKRIKASSDEINSPLAFFEIFLQKELVEAMKIHPGITSDWDGHVNAGDFDVVYPLAVGILRNAASAGFSKHSNTYDEAHAVSVAFCEELNELFQCSGEEKYELIPIKSYVEMAAEAGMVEIKDGMVSLTAQGVEAAQSVGREIKKGQN